jgi:large subunit ribosomal protein L23
MKTPQDIIKTIVITEKSALAAETLGKYVFVVADSANKIEIRKAVETLFNVKVGAVNVLNRKGKKKRMRTAKYGKRPDTKRAVVTLAEGTIEVL